MLKISGVSKHFGGIRAISDCSFEVKPIEICGLIGPNGAGKTTLVNLITGSLKPDEGEIRLRGELINGLPPYKITSRGVVRTFQDLRLFKKLTVIENVLFARQNSSGESPLSCLLRTTRWKRQQSEHFENSMHCLREVGLHDKCYELTENLSYGEEKLLSLARALATEADLILLDEPASGLDIDSIHKFLALIVNLQKRQKTILIIEHNFSIIKEIASHIVFLHYGHVIGEGDPGEIVKDKKLTSIYFGA